MSANCKTCMARSYGAPLCETCALRAEVEALRARVKTLAEALTAVCGHFIGINHHRDECPGLLAHDGLTVLGPVCTDHLIAEQAEAALAGRAPDAPPSPDLRGLLEAVDAVARIARGLALRDALALGINALAAARKEWP